MTEYQLYALLISVLTALAGGAGFIMGLRGSTGAMSGGGVLRPNRNGRSRIMSVS
jgi:hypothetical protein